MRRAAALCALMCAASAAFAHSASDAYLSLTAEKDAAGLLVHGQWDIALRDLDFVLGLDAQGSGHLTWGDIRRHQAAIERYAYGHLHLQAGSGGCSLRPTRQLISDHADGAYAALFFEVRCAGRPPSITVDYRLFFAIDPSHRGIFVMHDGGQVATAVLSPQNARIEVAL